jgi:hypothetical protein
MKALLLAAVVFFSLRAMAIEEGEVLKSNCPATNQLADRGPKVVADTTANDIQPEIDVTVKK